MAGISLKRPANLGLLPTRSPRGKATALHANNMKKQRIIDHLRILIVIPAVYLTYQLLANADFALWPHTKPIFHIWRYVSELLICLGCLLPVFFIAPKIIRYVSLGVVLSFWLINEFSLYINPFEIVDFERYRTFHVVLYIGTAILSYAAMTVMYEKRKPILYQ